MLLLNRALSSQSMDCTKMLCFQPCDRVHSAVTMSRGWLRSGATMTAGVETSRYGSTLPGGAKLVRSEPCCGCSFGGNSYPNSVVAS